MNPYLKLLGVLAALLIGASLAVVVFDGGTLVSPAFVLGLVLGVLWLVIMAVQHDRPKEHSDV